MATKKKSVKRAKPVKKAEVSCCKPNSKHKCCCGVVAHIFLVVGAFLITWGGLSLVDGAATFVGVLKSPIFWGMLIVLAGFCSMHACKCKE